MGKRSKTKIINELKEIQDTIDYLEDYRKNAQFYIHNILDKNLHYAYIKREEICKKAGYGDLTNLSEILPKEEV